MEISGDIRCDLCLTVFVTYKDEDHADRADQHTGGPNNARVPAVADNTHPAENKENSQRNFPRWHPFFAWPEGITAWAIFLTLMAIAEQTKETAKAAKASQKSAEAALVQLNQTTAMERARVEVRIGPLNINLPEGPKGLRPETRIPSAPCWSLTTNILLRNIGAGRAFITRSGGRLDAYERCPTTRH